MTTTPNTEPTPQAGSGSEPQPQAGTSQGQAPNEPQTTQTSLDELQRQIADLRKENASHRKKANEQQQAAQAAEEQRLREAGEFKQLAEKHEARVKELEPVVERHNALSAKIRKQIQTATKDWPAEIKAFYPGDDADIDALQDWYDRSQPLLDKLQQQARGTMPGNRPNPQATGQMPGKADVLEATKQARKSERNYYI